MPAMSTWMSTLILGLLLTTGAAAGEAEPQAAAAPTPVFAEGEHASAYHAYKKAIGGKHVHVVGKNVETQVKIEVDGNKRRVLVTVPVDKFDSGSGRRDKDVAKYLGGSKKAPLLISSAWLEAADFGRLAYGPEGDCAGQVEIQGVKKDLTLHVKGDGKTIWVEAATSFSKLGLEPPTVGPFGWLGSVFDPLTLTAQIQIDKSEVPAGAISAPAAPKKAGKKK